MFTTFPPSLRPCYPLQSRLLFCNAHLARHRSGKLSLNRPIVRQPFSPPGNGHSVIPWPSKRGQYQVQQAIFGVGAPEAFLVVVVALVVFGPKGLAEAAKSLGKTLRSFSPTIRELAEVSTDLKSSLEQEIGLNEIRQDFRSVVNPSTLSSRPELDTEIDPDIEAKRKESGKLAWGEPPVVTEVSVEEDSKLKDVSVEELEAELLRRKERDST